MSGNKPDAALVQRAIDVYVKTAYPDGPPVAVRSMLATERSWAGHLTDAPVFIKDDPKNTTKYSMRLGNASYPHMKLVIERAPDEKQGFLFRADAHDAHCCPPAGTPEHDAFRQLMTKNQEVITAVEKAWAAAGVPTMKTYLQADLARRQQKQAT
jgi:hypothetical protein